MEKGDLILAHNTPLAASYSDKLGYQWLGPFHIKEVCGNGSYLMEELDGTAFQYPVHGDCLKFYYKPIELPEEELETHKPKEDNGSDNNKPGKIDPEPSGPTKEIEDLRDYIPEGQPFVVVVP